MITLKAAGRLGEGVTCNVETGKAIARAGLHPATGGDGLSLCSGDMLLEALVACAGVTINAVASVSPSRFVTDGSSLKATSTSVARSASTRRRRSASRRSGFASSSTPTPPRSSSRRCCKLTERYCVVFQTLAKPPTMEFKRTV